MQNDLIINAIESMQRESQAIHELATLEEITHELARRSVWGMSRFTSDGMVIEPSAIRYGRGAVEIAGISINGQPFSCDEFVEQMQG